MSEGSKVKQKQPVHSPCGCFHLSYFSHCCNKIQDKKQLKEGRVCSGLQGITARPTGRQERVARP